jgi:hypothetical protein
MYILLVSPDKTFVLWCAKPGEGAMSEGNSDALRS